MGLDDCKDIGIIAKKRSPDFNFVASAIWIRTSNHPAAFYVYLL